MLSMNNYDLLDHFLCIHLIIVVSSCKYGSWHMIFFNILFHFVNVGTPFCLAGGGGGMEHVIGWIWAAKGQRKTCSYFTM